VQADDGSARRGSALVGAGIFLSRLSGLVREAAIAAFLGRSFAADAYTAAMRIPNLLQNLLGEGVLSASFIPVYARLLAEGREEEAGRVAGAVAGLLTALTGVLVVVGVLLAEPITSVLARGFTGERRDLAVTLVRIVTPGVGFLVLSAWCLGVLNSHRRFFLSYVAPVLWNGAQVAALVAAGAAVLGGLPDGTVGDATLARLATWLGVGTLVGGLLQFAVQLPTGLRLTRGLRPSVSVAEPATRRVLRAFGPVVAGRGVVQISAWVDLLLASFLAIGALAALRYSQVLYLLPISLFGMAVAAAELPELSASGAAERDRLVGRLDAGLARIAFFVVPTVAVYLVIGDHVVGTLFQRGEFDPLATQLVWLVLGGYALGLVASTGARLLQNALYAVGAPSVPAKISALRVAVSALVGVALMLQLDRVAVTEAGLVLVGALPAFTPLPEAVRESPEAGVRLGALGLALGAGLTPWLEYVLLRRAVSGRVGETRLAGGTLGRVLAAALVAAAIGLAARPLVAGLPPLAALIIAGGAMGVTYLAVARWLAVPEARDLGGLVRRLTRRG
jgi:putative peptidoglycan lipid II flippase